ncbi:DNA-binding domain-containing protein [Psychromonas antarctica]|uniref:HvfC/BufC N-terminal domain-containing protein n=1 Tax=Psychromonas antarctica TaxID=67573 RepID=UPI001EE856DA|nr:DNA-binding domain-containing protein [Psychromonas antarctica]MCG6201361.1 DNA-binding domain-containing protein [Psychromonas antarctica]
MKLDMLQQQFTDALLYRNSLITSEIKDKELLSSKALLQIYRNSFVMGVTEALSITYQHSLSLVGETFFNAVARQFILQQPPQENNIISYGNGFSHFLQNLEQLQSLPYIAEMARFEWLLEQTSNAPFQSELLDTAKLASIPPEQLDIITFQIPSQISLFTSEQNILSLYQMIITNKVQETDLNTPCYMALKKQSDFSVELISLTKETFLLVQQISQHRPLGKIEPADLHLLLPSLLEKGLLNGFTIKENI